MNQQSNSPIQITVLYDYRMLKHQPSNEHSFENPARIVSIIENLKNQEQIMNNKYFFLIDKVEACPIKYLEMTHKIEYIDYIKELWDKEKTTLHSNTMWFTFENALLAVGGAINAVDLVCSNKSKTAFAVIRPPGHHQGLQGELDGFCIFNNIAICANYIKSKFKYKKILIIDWDVHHGDGTQQIFYEDNQVLFCSLHQFDKGRFYPCGEGSQEFIGKGKGEGFNINISFNAHDQEKRSIGDADYNFIFDFILYPIFNSFSPEIILISCGFDSTEGDPLGSIGIQQIYSYWLQKLYLLIQSKIVLLLEGGYNFNSIQKASISVIQTLLDLKEQKEVKQFTYTFDQITSACINCSIISYKILINYWPCLMKHKKEFQDFLQYKVINDFKSDFQPIMFDNDDVLKRQIVEINELNYLLLKSFYNLNNIKDVPIIIKLQMWITNQNIAQIKYQIWNPKNYNEPYIRILIPINLKQNRKKTLIQSQIQIQFQNEIILNLLKIIFNDNIDPQIEQSAHNLQKYSQLKSHILHFQAFQEKNQSKIQSMIRYVKEFQTILKYLIERINNCKDNIFCIQIFQMSKDIDDYNFQMNFQIMKLHSYFEMQEVKLKIELTENMISFYQQQLLELLQNQFQLSLLIVKILQNDEYNDQLKQ